MDLNDQQLLRYSRQLMLPDFDVAGQQALVAGRALVVGLGGLGSPAAMYLGSAGVGCLQLVDDDDVELSNLQRQIAHSTADIGSAKVESARNTIEALNPDVRCIVTEQRLAGRALFDAVSQADVVIDASDNFSTRFALNRACVESKTPLVSGAAIGAEAQLSVFDLSKPESPCYACLYADTGDENLSCAESGVMAPLVGIIGAMQAFEAIKVLANYGEPLVGRLLVLDAKTMEWRSLGVKPKVGCDVCGGAARSTGR